MRSRDGEIVGGQIHVEGDEGETHSHDRGPRPGVELRRAGIGGALRGGQFGGQALVFAPTHVGQRLSLRPGGGLLVVVDGDALLPDPLPQPPRQHHRLLVRHPTQGHERDHVNRPQARMGPFVLPHVDDREGLPAQSLGGCQHRLRLAHVGEHGPVVIGVGAPVEQLHPRSRPDRPATTAR